MEEKFEITREQVETILSQMTFVGMKFNGQEGSKVEWGTDGIPALVFNERCDKKFRDTYAQLASMVTGERVGVFEISAGAKKIYQIIVPEVVASMTPHCSGSSLPAFKR